MGEGERRNGSEHQRFGGIIAVQREIVVLDIDVAGVLALVAERALPLTGATASAVEMVEGAALVRRAASGTFARGQAAHPARGALSTAEGEVLLCLDSELDGRVDREACRRDGVRSLIVVPLVRGADCVGVLKVAHPKVNAFGAGDADTLEMLAALVSAVLSRASASEARELELRAVSSQSEGEDALRASEHRFRSLAEYASDAVISVDAAGNIVFWNHSAVRVFGYETSEAIGRGLWTILLAGPERAGGTSVVELLAARAAANLVTPLELRARRKNDTELPVEVSVSTWTSGEERLYTAILRDVTERKLIQEQLSHATRLISIGTLASGIGHEINNPLSYVMYNLEFATETIEDLIAESTELSGLSVASLQKLAPLRDDLVEAANGADRIRAILRDLRTFSRAGDERRLAISVSRAADAAINMVFNQIRHQARVVKEYRDTALVDAVEGKLVQVIVNLLVNAAQATLPGRPEENVIAVRSAMAGDAWVVLEVSDTGTGIPAADLSRIFDPFYTTKAVGSGTGLGLSISYGIVQSFGGTIEVETELHRGSTFRVKLPVSAAQDLRTSHGPRTRSLPPPRRGRVMVIDDEPQVSASLQRMLAREHDVVAYTSSLAAAAELRSGARYDMILCDLMMPDLPGWQLYDGLSADQKQCIAFMTGGAFHPSARAFLAGIKNAVLDKPIDAKQLRALMRERIATT